MKLTVFERLRAARDLSAADVVASMLAAGFSTAVDLAPVFAGTKEPTIGMTRALLGLLGATDADEVDTWIAMGWREVDARVLVNALPPRPVPLLVRAADLGERATTKDPR